MLQPTQFGRPPRAATRTLRAKPGSNVHPGSEAVDGKEEQHEKKHRNPIETHHTRDN